MRNRKHKLAVISSMYENEDSFEAIKKLSLQETMAIIECFLEEIKRQILDGTNVTFKDFGEFTIKTPKTKTHRSYNIKTKKIEVKKRKNRLIFHPKFTIDKIK